VERVNQVAQSIGIRGSQLITYNHSFQPFRHGDKEMIVPLFSRGDGANSLGSDSMLNAKGLKLLGGTLNGQTMKSDIFRVLLQTTNITGAPLREWRTNRATWSGSSNPRNSAFPEPVGVSFDRGLADLFP
jgi:hypothetical protein